MRTPRPPATVALGDLFRDGFLCEQDVLPGGRVDETVRVRAERAYADFLETRPRTAPPLSPPPPPPPPRTTSAHVHRVGVRQRLTSSERERVPKPLVVDTCCVCLAKPRDHAFDPCFHMCVCASCAPRVVKCPMCRERVRRVQRIFV